MTDYNQIKGVRNSHLGQFLKSPLHYQYAVNNGIKDTPAMKFGRLYHCYMLEPDRVADLYAVWDEDNRPNPDKTFRDKENAEFKTTFLKSAADFGKEVIDRALIEKAKAMRPVLMSHPVARMLIEMAGVCEKVFTWNYTDPITGKTVAAKCKPDKISADGNWVMDLKTTNDATPPAFARTCANYGYHRQPAMYLDGTGANRFSFVAQETVEPYAVNVFHASKEFIKEGRWAYEFAMRGIIDCREKYGPETGEKLWPGYQYWSKSHEVDLPAWASKIDFYMSNPTPAKPVKVDNSPLFL